MRNFDDSNVCCLYEVEKKLKLILIAIKNHAALVIRTRPPPIAFEAFHLT